MGAPSNDGRDRLEGLFRSTGEERLLQAGEMLYQAGSASKEVYYVDSGVLRLSAGGQHVADKGAGSIVGEVAAIDQGVRYVTAIAASDTIVRSLDAAEFRKAVQADGEVCFAVVLMLADTLRNATGSFPWATETLPVERSAVAADGSSVRILGRVGGASAVHCTVPAHEVGRPSWNDGIDELWYFLTGLGQLWRQRRDGSQAAEVIDVRPGSVVTIPRDVDFQFRCTGDDTLTFLCLTSPPWVGPEQNHASAEGFWSVDTDVHDIRTE